ncbi:hypothetical protein [Streptomyces anulatus]|uniref:hypothetical protein n=1 Tax=Streptomyces anulatus TaxID=1892 RepID=UPI003864B1F7|nr:hypothetical protein OG882_21460 [Streptomyces anulatus]
MDTVDRIALPYGSGVGGTPPDRRLVAVGTITRHDGRTTTVRATEAGVTGSIRPTGGTR